MFSAQLGSNTRSTEIGGDADFSFSDKPANGVSHYFSSGKTDPNSSEALYDEINITGKNYNSGILAVDNMPVVKKYVTENYGADLKQAVKDQLKDLYKTRPEDWEKNKKIVEEAIIKQYGIPRNKINKFRKVIDPIIEEAVLTPHSNTSQTSLNNIFNKKLHVKIENKSHVAGQVLELTKMTLKDSLWEPRRHSDIHMLETSDNARIRLNTKDEKLTVHKAYQGGADFLFGYDVRESDKPALTFEEKVSGQSGVVLERRPENLKTLDGRKLIAAEKADSNSFAFKQNYRQGLYELLLKQCEGGFCLGVQRLAIPEAEAVLYAQQAYAANTLFGLRAADRGDDVYAADPSRQKLWLRFIGGRSHQNIRGGAAADGRRKGVQIGGEVFVRQNEGSRLAIGVMGGRAGQHASVNGKGGAAGSYLHGYGGGVYAAWHQLRDKQTGAYLDGWLQYQRFKHRINDENRAERYKTKGWTASVEGGYNALVAEGVVGKGNNVRFYLQPQAQFTYLGVNGGFTDSEGTAVGLLGSGQWQSRAGIRAKTRFALRNGVNLQPFAAFNVLHRSKSFGVEMDGEKQTLAGRTALEGRFGIEAGWKGHMSARIGYGKRTDGDKEAALSLKWLF
ncbi:autotransporter outer membrane beta-barrel domain-containing protein [Neisseria meningitidis]|nr:autotransporter outer membrane beta-barrel domain-containing protein [Neisseria meningitidis]MBG8607364.1 autotransporter outer membrane beta-barrel domain-containing protein [Neisseria meningitidis]MBG8638443.1 autotransporter outer membrane beta-barrel domain-containing protein [Neisseria meningitidis]MBG8656365.1 autotransporter outer membrane beta-barrel domain-containing protein [Neisseria meningitidis]MBG8658285.1 autotransporter outer membrane beta-barrel domain-containing protein [Ne